MECAHFSRFGIYTCVSRINRRITINNINGKPFSATDKYLIITSSFIADGGDTYGAFQEIPRIDIADLDEELFSAYITEGSAA